MPSHDDLNSVIVADDSGQCRNTLRTALMECGFLVLLVWDGLEALETASSTSVRLVLLDVRMPHMDGLQACARIRDLPGYGCVPIVMLSGYASAAMRAAAEQAGANLFLVKPISNLALKQAILPLLGATSGTAGGEFRMEAPARAVASVWRGKGTGAGTQGAGDLSARQCLHETLTRTRLVPPR